MHGKKLPFVAQNVCYDESYAYNDGSMLDISALDLKLCIAPSHDNMFAIILSCSSVCVFVV